MRDVELTGLLLAGGEARRLGGRDKGLVRWQGEPMAAAVVRAMRPLVASVVVSANRSRADYEALADAVVADPADWSWCGPLAGLLAGLRGARSRGASAVLVSPCDTPSVTVDLFERLLSAWRCAPERAVFARADRDHPLHGVYPVSVIPVLEEALLDGERRVMAFTRSIDAAPVDVLDAVDQLRNRNRPEDF
ncbi:molybdenum cofactor guanylyltransferase [Tamilnaduibacter salinus]|uniref:Molybdenum cofactor guanylyltransferase n=1 Tax=Tamilnaduibacter salinus TaxID=1484056 RepID=A0A2U1CXM6_9GAMM|nr:molybdenum cofactor guanylyltransferase MobA [Tamilnaduibacter salinus]PVY76913.1 molybdenum cofactor guanylyltransferase [Tamilnaduibacter salinus]